MRTRLSRCLSGSASVHSAETTRQRNPRRECLTRVRVSALSRAYTLRENYDTPHVRERRRAPFSFDSEQARRIFDSVFNSLGTRSPMCPKHEWLDGLS